MNNTLLALVVGLAAGVCGGLVPGMLRGDSSGSSASAEAGADLGPVLDRLDRIEEQLAASRPMLRGTGGAADDAPAVTLPKLAEGDEAILDAILARYDARMRQAMAEVLDERFEGGIPEIGISDAVEIPEKKRVTLGELAQELELSRHQEDELRRIHEESMEKALALLATEEDGGIETVRRDLESAREDPAKAAELVTKYMGRVIGNIGGFIMLEQEHDKRVNELLGEDKAQRLENDYEVTDLDPYDLEAVFTVGFGD